LILKLHISAIKPGK